MIKKRSTCGLLKKRKFESLDTESLVNDIKDILDENDFEFYDKQRDGGEWVMEFYINRDTWTCVFLSIDSSVDVKVYRADNNKLTSLNIRDAKDLRKLEAELF